MNVVFWVRGSNEYSDDLYKSNNPKLVKLSGTLSSETYEQFKVPFRDDLNQLMTKHDVKGEYILNENQTGSYYRRFLCSNLFQIPNQAH